MRVSVSVVVSETSITVVSPYHKDFVDLARQMGGKWQKTEWVFSIRRERAVRAALKEIYGTDGSSSVETVVIEIALDNLKLDSPELVIGALTVLKKWSRDALPILGEGCAVVKGALWARGGSARYPCITWEAGTVIEAMNIPLSLADQLIQQHPAVYSIIGKF